MPTYDYQCQKCGTFEVTQKITEEALKSCPTCSGPVTRLISASAFHLKGSGWYKTDYGSSSSSGGATKSSSSSTSTSSTPTTPSKNGGSCGSGGCGSC